MLNALSKRLALSPRPHRRSERHKKAHTVHEENVSLDYGSHGILRHPNGRTTDSPRNARHSMPPNLSDIQIVLTEPDPFLDESELDGNCTSFLRKQNHDGDIIHRLRKAGDMALPISTPSSPFNSPKNKRIHMGLSKVKLKKSHSDIKSKHEKGTPFVKTNRGSFCPPEMDTSKTYMVIAQEVIEEESDFEVQRISDYENYLDELLVNTDTSHPDYDHLNKAATKVKMLLMEDDEDNTLMEGGGGECGNFENAEKVGSVQDRFPHDDLQLLHDSEEKAVLKRALQNRRRSAPGAVLLKSLKSRPTLVRSGGSGSNLPGLPGFIRGRRASVGNSVNRTYVLEGPVQLTAGLQTQERYLFLFNDILLIAKQRSSTAFKLKQRVRVGEIWIAACLDDVSETTCPTDRSFVIGWPVTNHVATFDTEDLKNKWSDKLTECIASEKDKEQKKSTVVKIINKDTSNNNLVSSKLMHVHQSDQAAEIVERCIEEFHINSGDAKDYQLWSVSKDDSPYPLIGHEHPYSIAMGHLRDYGSDEMGLLDRDTQFILRETKKAPQKLSVEETNKRLKKNKRSPLNFFKRKNLQEKKSHLFGISLADLSSEGNTLPKPVMDMLLCLFTHGPFTSGVFRTSANERKKRELREKLDLGEECVLDTVGVSVIAATLKDFLRNLPNCLLTFELYERWVAIVDMRDDAVKIQKIQNLLSELPTLHLELLRRLMCILHHIDYRSKDNKMDAYNLAICISQSLLWPSSERGVTSDIGCQMKSVPLLVQFMVEHTSDIFGDDCSSIYGQPPSLKQRGDSSTDSDSTHSILDSHNGPSQRDNSSLDSLGGDFYINSELESSPKFAKSHLSPTNLSRDSGLFSSDNALYEDNAENVVSEPLGQTQVKKTPISRSVSQFDSHQTPVESYGPLSRSYDSTLDTVAEQTPVAPPRKNRRRSDPPSDGDDISNTDTSLAQASATAPVLRTSASAQSVSEMKRMTSKHNKRTSNDSLGSVEENNEYSDGGELSSMDQLRDFQNKMSTDLGTIHKSESGAKLYINEDLIHSAEYEDPHDRAPPSLGLIPSNDSFKRQQEKQRNKANLTAPSPVTFDMCSSYPDNTSTRTLNRMQRVDLSASYSGSSSCEPQYSVSDSTDNEELASAFVDGEQTVIGALLADESTPVVSAQSTPIKGSSLNDKQSLESYSDLPSVNNISPPVSQLFTPPIEQSTPAPTTVLPQSTSIPVPQDQVDNSIIVDNRSDNVDTSVKSVQNRESTPYKVAMRPKKADDKHLRRGMNAKGADMFPSRLLRQSLDEKTLGVMVRAEPVTVRSSLDSQLSSQHKLAERSASFKVESSKTQNRSIALEKSTSDTTVPEYMRRFKGESRPENPPSYQEALQRKSMLTQSGRPLSLISEQDIIQEKQRSQLAKKLYSESLQQYSAQSDSASETPSSKDSTPKPVLKNTVKSEQSKNNSQISSQSLGRNGQSVPTSSPRQPPSYEEAIQRQQLQVPKRKVSSGSRDYIPPDTHVSRKSDSPRRHNDHGSKENMTRSNSSKEYRRQVSRSRERRSGQRLSDTRISDNTHNQRPKSASGLSRSKSDSSEHLNTRLRHYPNADSSSSDSDETDWPVIKPLSRSVERTNSKEKIRMRPAKSEERPSAHGKENNEPDSRKPTGRITTMRNRNWHKDLLEQYKDNTFYQPEKTAKILPTKGPAYEYSYKKSQSFDKSNATDSDKPKRRWTPPVHPTKDLVVKPVGYNKDFSKRTNHRENSPAKRNTNNTSNKKVVILKNKDSESKPANVQKAAPPPEPVISNSTPNLSVSSREEEEFVSGAEPEGISWSVAKLRHLYDAPKEEASKAKTSSHFYTPNSQPPSTMRSPRDNPSRMVQYGNSPREEVNPRAQEEYV